MYFSSVTALKTNSITVRGRKYKSTVSMLANARKDHSLTMGCSIQLAWRCSLEVTSVTPSHSPVGHRGKIVFSFVSTRIRTTMPAKKIKLGKWLLNLQCWRGYSRFSIFSSIVHGEVRDDRGNARVYHD